MSSERPQARNNSPGSPKCASRDRCFSSGPHKRANAPGAPPKVLRGSTASANEHAVHNLETRAPPHQKWELCLRAASTFTRNSHFAQKYPSAPAPTSLLQPRQENTRPKTDGPATGLKNSMARATTVSLREGPAGRRRVAYQAKVPRENGVATGYNRDCPQKTHVPKKG